jgi:ribosome recycling factor
MVAMAITIGPITATATRIATESRPITIRVWDDYSYSYIYKTIYRSYKVC